MPHRTKAQLRWTLTSAVLLALVILALLVTPALAFPDVPAGHAYEAAVNELSQRQIIGGYASGDFGLNDPVKRAQFAKMIVGTLGIAPNTSTETRFTDLGAPDANGYPHTYVQIAYECGITNGTNAAQTLFAPWNSIRRDQVVSMIVRGAKSVQPGSLADPPAGYTSLFDGVPEPHGQNLRIAEYNGLLDGLLGMGSGWSVTATATRGEVAQMLSNLLDLVEGGPSPSGQVWIYSDGSGDYPTIEAAMAAVAPDTTIYLGPGTFTLTKTLVVDFDLSLIGNGMEGADSTTVRYGADVVNVIGAAFYAEDIRFVSTASGRFANVMRAEDAYVGLRECHFSGGVRWNDTAGSGLYIHGSTTAAVIDCVFTQNDLHGIDVEEEAELEIANSECSYNGECGICLFEDGSALVTGCTITHNELHGVSATDYTDLQLDNSQCSYNGWSGVSFRDDSTGTVTGCTCSWNEKHGITLFDQSYGEITGCTCSSNDQVGIYFAEDSLGTAQGNECANNEWGIYVGVDSDPLILTNNLHGNVHDLYYE